MPRMEPLAAGFLILTGIALAVAGYQNLAGLADLWRLAAYIGAVGLIVVPLITDAFLRSAIVAVVAGVIIGRIGALALAVDHNQATAVFLWSANLYGIILVVARDQDRPYQSKLLDA